MLDPPLSDIGLAQCDNGMQHINEIDFETVYVSPMKRTLQTTTEMFKTHPNRANINFIVLPYAKENLHVSNDLCGPLSTTYPFFSKPENVHGIKFDFTLMHCYGRDSTW